MKKKETQSSNKEESNIRDGDMLELTCAKGEKQEQITPAWDHQFLLNEISSRKEHGEAKHISVVEVKL